MWRLDASLLVDLPPFQKLPQSQIREILDAAKTARFEEGAAVFEEGDDIDRFYLLLDGCIRVQRLTPAGEHVILLHIAPGQLFGIGAAMGRTTYPATAMAADECIVLMWPNRLWHEFVARHDGFATETFKLVGARLSEIQAVTMQLATSQVEQRVASALAGLMIKMGRKTPAGIEIDFPISRQNIADMTGSTLFTASRLLSAWEKEGVISGSRKNVVITDPARLRTLAADPAKDGLANV